jgi:hypothetical protein
MLSQKLRSLKSWFDQCLVDGREMTAEGAVAFSRELEAAADAAEAMEVAGVPADALAPRAPAGAQPDDPKVTVLPVHARVPASDSE